jgi:hypothetical protein
MNSGKQEPTRRQFVFEDSRPASKPESKSRLAARALSNAAVERRLARQGGCNSAERLADAERLESNAAELMKPVGVPTIRSGEVVYAPGNARPPRTIVDTLENPDGTALEASVARTELLLSDNADFVALAVDAAASMNAGNSFEKMLAHQLAALHTLTMKTAMRVLEFEKKLAASYDGVRQVDSVEFSRMAQATARLSSAFQDGLITMQRLHTGGAQTMTIRHVTVEAGAQAVIGNVRPGDPRAGKRGRGKPK